MLVEMLVASDEATSGSVMQNADRISPSSSGRSQRCFCSSVPNSASTSMLPVSGAAQFSASGARNERPVSSASGAYWRLDSPAPSGWPARNRFHRPRWRAFAFRSSMIGGRSQPRPSLASLAACSSKTDSAGTICSSRKAWSWPRSSSVRASNANSICYLLRPLPGSSSTQPRLYLPAGMAPRYGAVMNQVETARGPVDADSLGVTLMHEHIFILNEEIRENYPADYPDGWDDDGQVDSAITKLTELTGHGCRTIVDPTVLGLGRDIHRIRRVADGTDLNIIVATGLYTYNDVPFYFLYRQPRPSTGGVDPMTSLFVRDIQTGIADTGVKAAFLKCAVDEPGLTPGVERVLRAVCRAHTETGAPITVHTHPHSGTGREVVRVLREEGADLTKVVLGHSGDTSDLDYLTELADAGCLLGMDRFGLDMFLPG